MVQSKLGGATRIVGSSCARIDRLKIAALPAATPNASAFLRVIPHDDHIAPCVARAPLLDPEIVDVMEIHIRKQW
jgi:hypothetical protein